MDTLELNGVAFFTERDSLEAAVNREHGFATPQGRTFLVRVLLVDAIERDTLRTILAAGPVPVTLPSGESLTTALLSIEAEPWAWLPAIVELRIREVVTP